MLDPTYLIHPPWAQVSYGRNLHPAGEPGQEEVGERTTADAAVSSTPAAAVELQVNGQLYFAKKAVPQAGNHAGTLPIH